MESLVRSSASRRGLKPLIDEGDIAPRFRLPDQSGRHVDLQDNDIAGKPSIIVFCRDPAAPEGAGALTAFGRIDGEVRGRGGQVLVVSGRNVDVNAQAGGRLGLELPILADPDGAVFRDYGLDRGGIGQSAVVAFVLGANQHVVSVLSGAAEQQADRGLAAMEAEVAKRPTRLMDIHPPVLIVPGVFSREDCQRLITLFNMEGNIWVEPGHGDKGMTSDYKMKVPEYGRHDRVDHWVVNTEIRDFISARLQARLFPEIRKAFQYRITKAETYRIGCYEGERGGDLQGHRDNTSSLVAHRRFAVSINLNSEEFEGGELRFPEFGDQRYRPDTGAAIAFSCSLLHEALEIKRGRRFVLMAFVFGEH